MLGRSRAFIWNGWIGGHWLLPLTLESLSLNLNKSLQEKLKPPFLPSPPYSTCSLPRSQLVERDLPGHRTVGGMSQMIVVGLIPIPESLAQLWDWQRNEWVPQCPALEIQYTPCSHRFIDTHVGGLIKMVGAGDRCSLMCWRASSCERRPSQERQGCRVRFKPAPQRSQVAHECHAWPLLLSHEMGVIHRLQVHPWLYTEFETCSQVFNHAM